LFLLALHRSHRYNFSCVAQDVRLDFPSDEALHHDTPKSGYILVRLYRPESLKEPVQQTRSSVEQSLSALVSQLDKFIQIVDVASLVSLPTPLSVYNRQTLKRPDSSIFKSDMAGCIFALHGEYERVIFSRFYKWRRLSKANWTGTEELQIWLI